MSKTRKPSKKLTAKDKVEILRLLKEGHFQNRIAAKYDVNPGRISELKKTYENKSPEQDDFFSYEIGNKKNK